MIVLLSKKEENYKKMARRLMIIALIALVSSCALTPPKEKDEVPKLEQLSLAYRNVVTSKALFYNADTPVPAYDMASLPIIFYMSQLEKKGEAIFNKSLTVQNNFNSTLNRDVYTIPESEGVLAAEKLVTIEKLSEDAVAGDIFSSETLIRLFEPEEISESLKQIDARGVMVLSGNFDPVASKINLTNNISAYGLLNVLSAMQDSSWTLENRQAWFKSKILQSLNASNIGLEPEVNILGRLYIKNDTAIFFARIQEANLEAYDIVITFNNYKNEPAISKKLKSILHQVQMYHKGQMLSQSIKF